MSRYSVQPRVKKLQNQLVILFAIKLLIKLQKYQKVHHKLVQKQLKNKQKIQNLMEKYQKDVQKKDRKILMI